MAAKSDIGLRALKALGVVGSTLTAKTGDTTTIEQSYDEVYADLEEDALATWVTAGTVPNAIVPHLISLVAFGVIDVFSPDAERASLITQRASIAKREIARIVTQEYESLEEPDDF